MSWQRLMRCSLGGLVLIGGLVAGPLAPHRALAALSGCRSDPTVVLSNGATLDLSAAIGDTLSDVQTVNYVVHGPAGTHVIAFANTDALFGPKERFTFYADNAWNTYDTITTAYTGRGPVTVRASSITVSVLGGTLGFGAATGVNGQNLHMHFTSLL